MTNNAQFEIAKIIQRFLPILETKGTLSGHQRSMLKLMSICKTSALGGHKEQCDHCVHTRIHFNSCGNRNCPSCQGVNKEKWIFDRLYDMLPVKYFHCVFTVPSELYIYFRYNKKMLYDLMMRCVKDTLLAFGYDPKQKIDGKIGSILLLHTWTQKMTFHPHVHCIVPAGGINNKGQWVHSKSNGDFLFHVVAMSRLFRGKMLAGIHQLYKNGQLKMTDQMRADYRFTKNKLYKIDWVAYAKKAFGGPPQVLEYLGRYSHKICVSNYRIVNITDTHVTFRYLDRSAKKSKTKIIKGEDFLKLFAEHILPKGFVKIRHIGFLSSRSKKNDLDKARKSLGADPPPPKKKMTNREFIKLTTGKDPYLCPCCAIGEMVIISIIPALRGSPVKIPFRSIPKDRKVNIC
jgi:hypothetical protein